MEVLFEQNCRYGLELDNFVPRAQKEISGKDYFKGQEERFHGALAINLKDALTIFTLCRRQ
jgi:hypothetical protein